MDILAPFSFTHRDDVLPASTIEGALTGIDGGVVSGWAISRVQPDSPVEVEIVLGDRIIGTVTADRFLPALVEARIGHGSHGFEFRLARVPDVQFPTDLRARARGVPGFLRGRFTLSGPQALLPGNGRDAKRYAGAVDGIVDGRVIGWAVDLTEPTRRLSVGLYHADRLLGEALAVEPRPDVARAGIGDGRCGFRVALPVRVLDGKTRALNLRPVGTAHELSNSPVAFGPLTLPPALADVAAIRSRVEALEARAGTKESGSEALVHDLLRRFDALLAIQRDAFEREIAALRSEVAALKRARESGSTAIDRGQARSAKARRPV